MNVPHAERWRRISAALGPAFRFVGLSADEAEGIQRIQGTSQSKDISPSAMKNGRQPK